MKPPLMTKNAANASGFSVLELLIVAVMISVLVGFAITQIAQAKQNMTRANAIRELATYSKARLDSSVVTRRRPPRWPKWRSSTQISIA